MICHTFYCYFILKYYNDIDNLFKLSQYVYNNKAKILGVCLST